MQIWLKSASWFTRYCAHKYLLAQIWQFKSRTVEKEVKVTKTPNLLFIISQCYIHANLVEICQPVHEIWCTQALLGLKFGSLSPTVTLKIRSRSPKPNQLFILSHCYIHANLVKIPPTPPHPTSCSRDRANKKVSC